MHNAATAPARIPTTASNAVCHAGKVEGTGMGPAGLLRDPRATAMRSRAPAKSRAATRLRLQRGAAVAEPAPPGGIVSALLVDISNLRLQQRPFSGSGVVCRRYASASAQALWR
jgi:hypothetical protein